MTVYAFPAGIIPQSIKWDLIGKTAVFQSPTSHVTQTVTRAGERWKFSMTFTNLRGTEAGKVAGLIARVGQEHRFTLPFLGANNQGTASSATASGGSAGSNSFTVSMSGTILAGDWFSVNGELKMCVADRSGSGTMYFKPAMRTSTTGSLTLSGGTGKFMLADHVSSGTVGIGYFNNFQIECVEDPSA